MSPHSKEPSVAKDFFNQVKQAAKGTPYTVKKTDDGFDVTLNIVDAKWYGAFSKAGLSKVYTHHVTVSSKGTYTVTDDLRLIEWAAGVPKLTGSVERQYGRVIELSAEKVWAFDAQGNFGVQAEYKFNSEEGRDLIKGVAQQMGLKNKRGAAEKTGLWFAIIAGVGAVVSVVVNVIMLITGQYS